MSIHYNKFNLGLASNPNRHEKATASLMIQNDSSRVPNSNSNNPTKVIPFTMSVACVFGWIDVSVAQLGLTKAYSSPINTLTPKKLPSAASVFFKYRVKSYPFKAWPLPAVYMAKYGATKLAGEMVKSDKQDALNTTIEGMSRLLINNLASQFADRAIMEAVQAGNAIKKPSTPLLSVASGLFLMRDTSLWVGNTMSKDLDGVASWGARLAILFTTTGFHLAANLALANEPVKNIIPLIKGKNFLPILAFRMARVVTAELLVKGPDQFIGGKSNT